jgi:hypothetical protein
MFWLLLLLHRSGICCLLKREITLVKVYNFRIKSETTLYWKLQFMQCSVNKQVALYNKGSNLLGLHINMIWTLSNESWIVESITCTAKQGTCLKGQMSSQWINMTTFVKEKTTTWHFFKSCENIFTHIEVSIK